MSYNHYVRKGIIALLLIFVTGLGHTMAQSSVHSASLIQPVEGSRASSAFWSVIVRDSSGKILEGYNFDKLVRPASNLKLLTSASVLDALGSDFTYATYMYGLGSQQGSIWKGDIIIRGAGDPSISGKYYDNDRLYVLEKFYSMLDSAGIKKVEGNLIGNVAYFDQHPYPKGWSWDDLSFYYGVEISALSFNENAVDLQVFTDKDVGESPHIQWFPFDTDYVRFINDQIITPANSSYDEFYRRILGTNTIVLGSKVPQNYHEKESLSVKNAPMYFMDTFKKYLEGGGIDVTGRVMVDSQERSWESSRYKVLGFHRSPPLKELLNEINKESNNFYAEMLLKTAAAENYDTQGTTELGISIVKDFAKSMGMDTTSLEMTDGAGMSPATLMTVRDLSNLLVQMQHHSNFEAYKNSLAVAGEDGSLKHRFRNSSLEGRVWGKTGYISGVRSLSGYMEASSGQPLVFSIITNNYTQKTSYIDSIQQKILEQIYTKY